MGLFNSNNPSFKDDTYDKVGKTVATEGSVMTVNGTIGKAGILLLFVVAGAAITWNMALSIAYQSFVTPLMWFGLIAGFVFSLIVIFKPTTAPYLSPAYAICEGLFLGALSVIINSMYPGIVFQALCLTFIVATLMLALYRFRIIRATQKFRTVIVVATASIALFYLAGFILSFFSVEVPLIWSNSLFGIGFSVFVVIIAALNLILDFDFIEKGSDMQAPKFMEWYGAFGLMVTLVWMYIEILRLLMKIASSQR